MTPARWAVAGALVLAGLGVVWTAGPYLHAERMLDAAVVPPGSVQVFFLPGGAFAQPPQEPACAPLIDQTRYWIVPGDPQDIASFLRAHAPPGIPSHGAGQLSMARRPDDLLRRYRRGRGQQRGLPGRTGLHRCRPRRRNGRHPGRCRGGPRRCHVLLFRRTRTRAPGGVPWEQRSELCQGSWTISRVVDDAAVAAAWNSVSASRGSPSSPGSHHRSPGRGPLRRSACRFRSPSAQPQS